MVISISQIREKLVDKGLKVTPQRIAILEAIYCLDNHPTAEMIMDFIKDKYPGIASGTIYKVLDVFLEKGLIKKVKTDQEVMRYDGILKNHHHLYCTETEQILDYRNEELDRLLDRFFMENGIRDFEVKEIKLQINGRLIKKK